MSSLAVASFPISFCSISSHSSSHWRFIGITHYHPLGWSSNIIQHASCFRCFHFYVNVNSLDSTLSDRTVQLAKVQMRRLMKELSKCDFPFQCPRFGRDSKAVTPPGGFQSTHNRRKGSYSMTPLWFESAWLGWGWALFCSDIFGEFESRWEGVSGLWKLIGQCQWLHGF